VTVHVRTPATSANLGPGFDALGLALTLYDEIEVDLAGSGLSIEVTGEGPETADRAELHLVVQAIRATFDHLGAPQPPGLVLRCVNRIPHGRGLGSSASAIVCGVLAAQSIFYDSDSFEERDTLGIATEIEGHPDNVAACISGGLTIAWMAGGEARSVRLDVAPEVTPIAFVPNTSLATETARGLLPEAVPHKDAASNAGRAALLVAALTGGLDSSVLLDATADRLHQPYRAAAMPESAALVERLRHIGVPAVISGAGPTVLALTTTYQADSIGQEVGIGWHEHLLNVDRYGAAVRLTGS
jgi:homoserine kinase